MVAERKELCIKISKNNPAYGTLLTLAAAGFNVAKSVELVDSEENELLLDGIRYTKDVTIARFIARASDKAAVLFGKDAFEQAQVDYWLCLVERGFVFDEILRLAAERLKTANTLCLGRRTLADLMLFVALSSKEKVDGPFRSFFDEILGDPALGVAHKYVAKFEVSVASTEKPSSKAKAPNTGKSNDGPKSKANDDAKAKQKTKDEGKFVELPGAEKGKVIVRFPPEASGYLHIGHAKAALLNQYYQQVFEGQLIMRFDDTNPAKESSHFEQVILEDLKLLEVKPDRWSHTSDYFDVILELCEKLLKEGKAYVDETDSETMRKEREERKDSKFRNTPVEQNLKLWEEMKKGSVKGQECCVRIKMDMQSNNGAMRDPTIYRCKNEPHVRFGDKYKVYPTYDFACPIVDSIEGVTHALRTTEYTDRDDQYYFICDALGLRKPHIWSYARLNMTNTVMSKRKLTWFVQENHVDGWDDPRFPTVRGTIRRGLTVEGLKQFILAQGGSRSVVTMEWDKIWAFNKKVIDPVAPRYTGLATSEGLVTIFVEDQGEEEEKDVPLHPKTPNVGEKKIWYGKKILVESIDAQEMHVGDAVTFINWGNLKITGLEKDSAGKVTAVKAKLDLDNKDFKKTLKVTWIADVEQSPTIPVKGARYDHIISKAIVGKDEDWKQFINFNSKEYYDMKGESALATIKKGDIVQIQRKGFYICDSPYEKKSTFSGVEMPLVLIEIPDGSKPNGQKTAADESTTSASRSKANGNARLKVNIPEIPEVAKHDNLRILIEEQGNLVRSLKTSNPKGEEAKEAISKLLELKQQYKAVTGEDYKPEAQPALKASSAGPSGDGETLSKQIEEQGNLVRSLKSSNPKGEEAKAAINKLLELKKQYKTVTGRDYKPGAPVVAAPSAGPLGDGEDLSRQIEEQGGIVRSLKKENPKGPETKAAISKLLELKQLYKTTTGKEYKPAGSAQAPPSGKEVSGESFDPLVLYKQVEEQGNLVRSLKKSNPKGAEVKAALAKLLELKNLYKSTTGQEYVPNSPPSAL